MCLKHANNLQVLFYNFKLDVKKRDTFANF